MNEKLRDDLIAQAKQFEADAKLLQSEVNHLRSLAKDARALAGKLPKESVSTEEVTDAKV